MKDPNGVETSVSQAALYKIEDFNNEHPDDRTLIIDERKEKLLDYIGKWFRYDEYVTLEIDTEAGTCLVLENKE